MSYQGVALTRLAALGTLSRGAGEGLQCVEIKAPRPHCGRGKPNPEGLVGEGSVVGFLQ